MDYYATENLHLAAYIRSHDIDLREVAWSPGMEGNKCMFILRIEPNDPKLVQLLIDWETSKEAYLIKKVFGQTHKLRSELMSFMRNNQPKSTNGY